MKKALQLFVVLAAVIWFQPRCTEAGPFAYAACVAACHAAAAACVASLGPLAPFCVQGHTACMVTCGLTVACPTP